MKKVIIGLMMVLTFTLMKESVNAAEYQTYQEITFEIDGVKLLEDYTESDYKYYYKKINKRKFWGWRTHSSFNGEKAYFIKETLYVVENSGESPIIETLEFKVREESKKQYGASGTIGLSGSGKVKGFKLGLENKIKVNYEVATTEKTEENVVIKVSVDANTMLIVQIIGEGKISNGVAKYYRFFKNVKKGGYEIFVVTTEYYSIVKKPINEE